MEDPQPHGTQDIPVKSMKSSMLPKATKIPKNPFLQKGMDVKGYAKGRSPLSYAQRSVLPSNPKSPLTRVKPLVPNILDQATIDSINMDAAKKRASGFKWGIVREK
jgi:hypothetical protein